MISKQMRELIDKRKSLLPEDDEGIKECWKLELEVLTVSLDYTIEFLNNASEEEIIWCAEVWEDLSRYWKSKELIEAMENCQKRYPNIAEDLQLDIKFAKMGLNG